MPKCHKTFGFKSSINTAIIVWIDLQTIINIKTIIISNVQILK